MSPTELFFDDPEGGHYIRLLEIESPGLKIFLWPNLRTIQARWKQIDLDCDSPPANARSVQGIDRHETSRQVNLADKLGLWNEREAAEQGIINPEKVEIPCWRHALISFPHALLKEGLTILDTPGLNALGAEPELTLSMLPSAQAIVFVIAADTGVTKSDMDMWRNHVCHARGGSKRGLAVVMNKIDSMWDDLAGESGYQASIASQVKTSATTLKLEENSIFPVSAKQALLAKVKKDQALLKRSKIDILENYLAEGIVKQRRNILMETVTRDIGFLVNESLSLTETALANGIAQLEEFKKIDFQNQDMTGKLMAETRDRQNLYMSNIENFQASRRVFNVQAKMLIDSFSKERIDAIIRNTKHDMSKSLTTFGMKQNIRKLFDDLRDLLQDSVDITNETRRLVKAIHKKFHDEYGFKELEPQLFSIKQYQVELEQVFEEGEAFRVSAKTTMTEQSVVINRLYSTLIAKARNILRQAHADATAWSGSVLMPLMHQIKDHKKQIENRLHMLKKMNESKGTTAENIVALEAEIEPLKKQRNELLMMLKSMQLSGPSVSEPAKK